MYVFRQEDSQIEREALRNTLFLRLRTLLPHEYERIFVQRKANLSMPVPQSLCPLDMPKHSTSLKLVHFINRPVQDFDPKMLARHLAVAEAFMFVRLDEREFFYSTAQQSFSSIDAFIERYNRLTQILISATLQSKTPAKLAQFILKMAREFYELGTMNGFKACLAALQSACIHRLHLCDELSSKYRRRMLEFEEFSQAKDNFVLMRQTRCLVPWIGLLLKDINFISEVVKLAGNAGPTVGPSLRKVFQSIAESRGACSEWIQRNQHMLSQVSKILDWLDGTPVLYDTEELQYQKSKAIKS